MSIKESAGGSSTIGKLSCLNTYLPKDTPWTSPLIPANIPTKVLVSTVVKDIKDFSLDVANSRYFYNKPGSTVSKKFNIEVSSSLTSSASNHFVTISMYKNGQYEEGVGIYRKIATGSDAGAFAINGKVFLENEDYIEVFITATKEGTITLSYLSINIDEVIGG